MKMKENQHEGAYTTDRVMERTLGAFSTYPSANDWLGFGHPNKALTITNCCGGSGARGLYFVWKEMLTFRKGKLKVHLLLNRASKWADVESYIPYNGRVDIKIKQDLVLEVRLPEWVEPKDVKCEVSGKARELTFDGRYANVGEVQEDQVVQVTFPIFERTDRVTIQGADYTIVRRGNDVVWIDPPGKYVPFYQRGHYRNGKPLYRKVSRFVSDEDFFWW